MRRLLSALLLLAATRASAAGWTDARFQYDPRSHVWSRDGGAPTDHNLYNPNNNFTARFEQGRLKVLFDNYPDAGPTQRRDDVYLFRDEGEAQRLRPSFGEAPAPVDLIFSAPKGRGADAADHLVRQTFADGIWTSVREENGCAVSEEQFLVAGDPDERALVERRVVRNASEAALTLNVRGVLWAALQKNVYDYWNAFHPSWTAVETWDPGLNAAVARSGDGRLWLVAGAVTDDSAVRWSASASSAAPSTAQWSADVRFAPGQTRVFALIAAAGATRDAAVREYARLAAEGADASAGRTRAEWHRHLWEQGVFKTGDASLDALNTLKYIMDANYAGENGGFTAAKYGHPEIWARDSGYTALSSTYFEPGRTRHTLETALHSGYVSGQDGTSMLVIASEHYARWTGDRSFARDNVPLLTKSMQGLWNSRRRDGFLVDRGGGLDTWRDMPAQQARLKGEANMYQQVLFSAALTRLSRLLDDVGLTDQARVWRRRAQETAQALNRAVSAGGFWQPGPGDYADFVDAKDPAGQTHYDEVGHSLGVLWGVFPKRRDATVMARASSLTAPNGLGHVDIQPYGSKPDFNDGGIWSFANFLEAGAQLAAGRGGEFMSLMNAQSRTMGIVPGALPEALGPAQTKGPITPVSTSWNSAGLYVMTRELFGVEGDGFQHQLTLTPHIPEQLRGAALSLMRLPFSDWLVSITYRLVAGGQVSVSVDAQKQGQPAQTRHERFTVPDGQSRTIALP